MMQLKRTEPHLRWVISPVVSWFWTVVKVIDIPVHFLEYPSTCIRSQNFDFVLAIAITPILSSVKFFTVKIVSAITGVDTTYTCTPFSTIFASYQSSGNTVTKPGVHMKITKHKHNSISLCDSTCFGQLRIVAPISFNLRSVQIGSRDHVKRFVRVISRYPTMRRVSLLTLKTKKNLTPSENTRRENRRTQCSLKKSWWSKFVDIS